MTLKEITYKGESWFKIANHDQMRPFFMNIVSDSNHWMFISSNGGLTAGRKNNSYALFPYYTDDKITESADITGSKTIFQVHQEGGEAQIWEPFSERYTGKYKITRNICKNFFGNKILFEEVNHDLGLSFRYQWNSSNMYGFVRRSEISNQSGKSCKVTMIDGIQNVLPYGVEPDLQTESSNLVDAYKKSELVKESGLGIFALSAIIVDKAEPSEALKANIAWSLGLDNPTYLLSSLQLNDFRNLEPVQEEKEIKGEKGAYLVHTSLELEDGDSREWKIVANVNQTHSQIIELNHRIQNDDELESIIDQDVQRGTKKLKELIAGADGQRLTADRMKDARHFSNVLFNIMRGGTFDYNYRIEKNDLVSYLINASSDVYSRNTGFLNGLKDEFSRSELYKHLEECKDPDLYRLCREYLPLKFSRRHGDPSRPWNYFTINTHSEIDGSKILDYEGNWRDIFQNWEALVHSYPEFIDGMIFKFLNTSTFDGYNPYRVTKSGFDWETIEPDNPWSYIGYWGDHQIIYMLKLLEFYRMHEPDALESLYGNDIFVYANVPYRIKPYDEIAKDPKNTIDFDEKLDLKIRDDVAEKGADGALLRNGKGDIHRVNFIEKILASVLAKVSNFIPEGGIWMNTQRPEWNDANNALVGNGVSMVTLYYLRRFLKFFEELLAGTNVDKVEVSKEMYDLFSRITKVLESNKDLLNGGISDSDRKKITDALGKAGGEYRTHIYDHGFSGEKVTLQVSEFAGFVDVALKFMEHSIETNHRTDDLYHSYNIMSMEDDGITISYLDEMLEGQVAILSSGYLDSEESLNVLNALRKSALYRKDQNSYILYPNKDLPGFLEKNNIPEASVQKSKLLQTLLEKGDNSVIVQDMKGGYHFNGNFRNAGDLKAELDNLKSKGYEELVEEDGDTVLKIFEEVFNHKAFTGRSGTFFAYEGLGSIYWHMVSKLHLAAAEVCLKSFKDDAEKTIRDSLLNHFYEIGEGIGIHKSPELYGAFPTDAYSHTPAHRGAQQPGMTGQVKEDILTSIYELGAFVKNGILYFDPLVLRKDEFKTEKGTLQFVNVMHESEEIKLSENNLCFSYCQVPVIYQIADSENTEIVFRNGKTQTIDSLTLNEELSSQLFTRSGEIEKINVSLNEDRLN